MQKLKVVDDELIQPIENDTLEEIKEPQPTLEKEESKDSAGK